MDDPAKSHAVHTSLSQLDEMAKSSQLSDVNDEIDEGRRFSLDRIFYLIGEARRRVSKLNGVRANISVFNNISNSSNAIRQELENYISNRNITHIQRSGTG